MRSGIIDLIYLIGQWFFGLVQKSAVWRLFLRVYNYVSDTYQKSFIPKLFKKERTYTVKSLSYGLFNLPFTILNAITKKLSPFCSRLTQNSIIITICKYVPVAGVYVAVALGPFVPTMVLAGICIVSIVALVIKSLCETNFKWKTNGATALVVAWLCILLISSWFSYARLGSLEVCAMYYVFVGFFFVCINTLNCEEHIKSISQVFVIAAVAVAVYGIMQYVFGWTTQNAWIDETMFEGDTMRVYSTLGNPNVLGEYLLLALPLAAIFMVRYKKETWSKWFYGVSFVIILGCLVLTQSRGCWLGFFLAAILFVSFYNGKLWLAAIALVALVPIVIPDSIASRLMSVGNMHDTSTSYRVFIWIGVLRMLKDYFIGGIGMGEAPFAKIYPHYSLNTIIAPHSHNTFLQITVESGIVSLIIFICLMALIFKYAYVVFKKHEVKSFESTVSLAFAAGLAGFLLQSLFDYTFYNYRVMALFFMYLAIGVSQYMNDTVDSGVKAIDENN